MQHAWLLSSQPALHCRPEKDPATTPLASNLPPRGPPQEAERFAQAWRGTPKATEAVRKADSQPTDHRQVIIPKTSLVEKKKKIQFCLLQFIQLIMHFFFLIWKLWTIIWKGGCDPTGLISTLIATNQEKELSVFPTSSFLSATRDWERNRFKMSEEYPRTFI